ncbi:GIY-YIG nuclease family protein [Mycolicibacterium sp. jd]|uniref:GIY-YIG nuclease family protein n=1 Tax=unclassified Mycolicibacterium TaxID=2636767 RepID=UPI00351BA33E
MAESISAKRNADAVSRFLAAQRYTRDEVFGEPCPVPAEAGVHGWWFRDIPGGIDVAGCQQQDGWTLLYVGITSGPPRADGKPRAPQDLRKRIRYHFGAGGASADGSTLRKSLGVLLGGELGFALRRVGSGKRMTFAGGEAVLTQWMAENAAVSWVLHPEPWHLERKLIDALEMPLNFQDNDSNAFAPELKRLRRDAAVKAGKMRVLAEWS